MQTSFAKVWQQDTKPQPVCILTSTFPKPLRALKRCSSVRREMDDREERGTHLFGPVPDGVEVCCRVGSNKPVFIRTNHTQEQRHVNLPRLQTFQSLAQLAHLLEVEEGAHRS